MRFLHDSLPARGLGSCAAHQEPGKKVHNPTTVWPIPHPFQEIYSHASETLVGQTRQLHVAGQVGVALDGRVSADFTEQCEQAMHKLEAMLGAAGMAMADVVRLTYYVVNRQDLQALNALRVERWSGCRPAVTTPC
jgi:2-iminobutanoate/2-iminopropanoate deaminase